MRCYCCPSCLSSYGLRAWELGCPACGCGRRQPIRSFTLEVEGNDAELQRLLHAFTREMEEMRREAEKDAWVDTLTGPRPLCIGLPIKGTLTVKRDFS